MSNPHEVMTVKCAVCGSVKRESNHWFAVWPSFNAFHCRPLASMTLQRCEEPVCGQGCAQRQLEIWMTNKRNEPENTPDYRDEEGLTDERPEIAVYRDRL